VGVNVQVCVCVCVWVGVYVCLCDCINPEREGCIIKGTINEIRPNTESQPKTKHNSNSTFISF
jgi:hypothetical protein